jgi:hypothetical protein
MKLATKMLVGLLAVLLLAAATSKAEEPDRAPSLSRRPILAEPEADYTLTTSTTSKGGLTVRESF